MTPIMVLRPEPGASATADRARELGLNPIVMPLFEVEPVEWEAPEPGRFDALLLTSANAVRVGGEQLRALRGLPVHAVGEATAEAAREAGFAAASHSDGGVDRLLDSLDPGLSLLHLCGEHRREPQRTRQAITPIVVYRSCERAHVDVRLRDGAIAMIHSPRAAQRFAELTEQRASTTIAAISAAAAEAAGTGWACVEIAEKPTDEALLALAARLCNKPDPQ